MSSSIQFSPLETVLPGTLLHDRWHVGDSKQRVAGQTGGVFSVTFDCLDTSEGVDVFLKVVDVNSALEQYGRDGMSVADILIKIGEEHKFESSLVSECTEGGLNKIVIGLDHGDVKVSGFEGPVLFLVFELAEGDTHKIKAITPELTHPHTCDKWWLKTLHQVAVGLNQLHKKEIAHQDVKPSNILFFEGLEAKLADLGRAVKKGAPSSNFRKNGAISHSPPELIYGVRPTEWGVRHLSVDIYMLGNLVYFHFSKGETVLLALLQRLEQAFDPYSGYSGSFSDALPALEEAFGRLITDFRLNLVDHLPEKCADELTSILRELCHPDPTKRGHPADHKMQHGSNYSAQRYINRFKRIGLSMA